MKKNKIILAIFLIISINSFAQKKSSLYVKSGLSFPVLNFQYYTDSKFSIKKTTPTVFAAVEYRRPITPLLSISIHFYALHNRFEHDYFAYQLKELQTSEATFNRTYIALCFPITFNYLMLNKQLYSIEVSGGLGLTINSLYATGMSSTLHNNLTSSDTVSIHSAMPNEFIKQYLFNGIVGAKLFLGKNKKIGFELNYINHFAFSAKQYNYVSEINSSQKKEFTGDIIFRLKSNYPSLGVFYRF